MFSSDQRGCQVWSRYGLKRLYAKLVLYILISLFLLQHKNYKGKNGINELTTQNKSAIHIVD